MKITRRLQCKSWAVCLAGAALLAGCGGGGGGGGSTGGGGGGGGTPLYTIGGNVTGLAGSITLQNNGADNLTLSANGAFTFATPIAAAVAYAVTVLAAPAGQTCAVANGSGSVGSANVTNVAVTCSTASGGGGGGGGGGVTGPRLSAGYAYTLAARADGSVVAWGSGMQGGSGTAVPGTAAKAISGLSGIGAVAATDLVGPSLAVNSSGSVFGWGFGVLGDLVPGAYGLVADAPVAIDLLGSAKQVSVCTGPPLPIAYALHADGSVSYVPATSVTAPNAQRTSTAATVAGLSSVVAMSERCAPDGIYQFAVVKSDGTVWNLKPNFSVVSGPAPNLSTSTVTIALEQVVGLPPIAAVSCGGVTVRYCFARAADGHVWAWGDNASGQLGDGTTTGRIVPIQVPGLASIAQVAAGSIASYAVTSDGTVYSWGSAFLGRAITNNNAFVPAPVALRSAAVALSSSALHAVVQLTDGSVWGWGTNSSGELGDGTSGAGADLPVQALGVNLN